MIAGLRFLFGLLLLTRNLNKFPWITSFLGFTFFVASVEIVSLSYYFSFGQTTVKIITEYRGVSRTLANK